MVAQGLRLAMTIGKAEIVACPPKVIHRYLTYDHGRCRTTDFALYGRNFGMNSMPAHSGRRRQE